MKSSRLYSRKWLNKVIDDRNIPDRVLLRFALELARQDLNTNKKLLSMAQKVLKGQVIPKSDFRKYINLRSGHTHDLAGCYREQCFHYASARTSSAHYLSSISRMSKTSASKQKVLLLKIINEELTPVEILLLLD